MEYESKELRCARCTTDGHCECCGEVPFGPFEFITAGAALGLCLLGIAALIDIGADIVVGWLQGVV